MARANGQRQTLRAANAILNGGVGSSRSSSTNREGAFRGRTSDRAGLLAARALRFDSGGRAAGIRSDGNVLQRRVASVLNARLRGRFQRAN